MAYPLRSSNYRYGSINKSAPGLYGTSDYELMIPEELASYKNSSNRLVAFYGEYRGQSG